MRCETCSLCSSAPSRLPTETQLFHDVRFLIEEVHMFTGVGYEVEKLVGTSRGGLNTLKNLAT